MDHASTDVKANSNQAITPSMLSWGKINGKQTFAMIAEDLDTAFTFAGFSCRQAQYLQQVRRASWAGTIRQSGGRKGSWPDALGCTVDVQLLEKYTKVKRQTWERVRNELIASKVLLQDEFGLLRINKQAHEWVHHKTGEPRLSADLIQFCLATQPDAPALQSRFEFERAAIDRRTPHLATYPTGPVDFDAPQHGCCTPCNTGDAVNATPVLHAEPVAYRNGREEEILQTKKEAAAVPATVGSADARGKIQPPPTISKAPPGPGANSPAAVALGRWAGQFGSKLADLARGYCDLVPSAWVELAIQRKLVGQRRRPDAVSCDLIAKILCDWMQTGVCPFLADGSRPAVMATKPAPALEYFRAEPGTAKKAGWRPGSRRATSRNLVGGGLPQ